MLGDSLNFGASPSIRARARLFIISGIFIFTPVQARCSWNAVKISDERFAEIVASTALGRQPFALYGITMKGFIKRSYTTYDRPDGIMQMNNEQRHAHGGAGIYEIREGSDSWEVRYLSLGGPIDGAGIAVIPGLRRLVADYSDGTLAATEFDPILADAKGSLFARKPGPGVERWPRGSILRPQANELLQSRAGLTYRVTISPSARLEATPVTFDIAKDLAVVAYGDPRGEGTDRFYAMDNDVETGIYEVEERKSGPWHVTHRLPGVARWQANHLVLGDVRGDRVPRLYAAGPRGVWEYAWDGTSFRAVEIKAKLPPLIGKTTGLLIGSFRPDKKQRLYQANGELLIEYTHMGDRWRAEAIQLGFGLLGPLLKAEAVDRAPRLFAMGYDTGLYELTWKEENPIAVMPFVARGLPAEEGNAMADIIRNRVVRNGNCPVLERERMDEILAEHKLQRSGAVDINTALPIGRLLNAGSLVGGSLGKMDNQHFATVAILSVKTGAILRTEYRQWEDDSMLQDIVEELADVICKASR